MQCVFCRIGLLRLSAKTGNMFFDIKNMIVPFFLLITTRAWLVLFFVEFVVHGKKTGAFHFRVLVFYWRLVVPHFFLFLSARNL